MNTKDRFYSIISKYDIDVFDFSEKIEDFRCFSDTTHINYEDKFVIGGNELEKNITLCFIIKGTKYINEILN